MHNLLPIDPVLDQIPSYPLENGSLRHIRELTDTPRFLAGAYHQAGPVFRIQAEDKVWIMLAGPEANQFVWNNTNLWNYPILFPSFLEQMGPDHLNNLEGQAHANKRTVLREGMDRGAVMRHLPGYNHWFGLELARKAGTGPLDLIDFWATTLTKANTKTVALVDLSDDQIKRLTDWEEQMLGGLNLGEARHAHYARPEYIALKAEAMGLMTRMVQERLDQPDRWKDAFADILRARGEQEGGYPDISCLVDDIYYLLVAGVHNTSRWINLVLLLLHFSPKWKGRVLEELESWDENDAMALAGLPNLKAVIMESQRLRPIVHFTPRYAAKDFEFAGYKIPAGTTLVIANSACHFLEELYEDPFSFRPERFLDNGKFAPRTNGFFGGGVHICVGRNFSMLQTPIAVARMLKSYEITYADEPAMKILAEDNGRPIPETMPASFRRRS